MALKQGSISIDTENIFPIIKKWLYSDKDIFIRELISNGCDAVSKHKRLVSLGETAGDDKPYKITVAVSKKNKTLSFSDNGIGMTADEIDKYINQVAFSGAEDFFNKYKDKMEESKYYFERFQLTPKLYVNKEVILKIKKDGRLFPLSKNCCDTFKFTYGATVAVKIKILEPLIADTITNTLVIESNNQDFMWTIENDKEYTILSQLLFTDNNVKNEEAYFKDTVFSCISIRDIKTDTVWKSGEGKAILLLKELITE